MCCQEKDYILGRQEQNCSLHSIQEYSVEYITISLLHYIMAWLRRNKALSCARKQGIMCWMQSQSLTKKILKKMYVSLDQLSMNKKFRKFMATTEMNKSDTYSKLERTEPLKLLSPSFYPHFCFFFNSNSSPALLISG